MVVSVLNKLESLKQLNLAKSKSSELQPDIKQQRKLILKNLAKNFVNNIINFQCEIVRDRIILDDRRVLKKSKKLKFDSPKSKTALVVDKKAPKSPEIIGFHEVDSDTSSQVVSESELKNLNNPKDAFHNIAKNFKDGKIYRIFRDSKGVEISVDQSEGFLRPEEVKGGKKRQGMSIIVDPTTMTGGSNVIISIRYEIPLTESSLPVVSTFNARRPEAAHHRLTSVVRSSSQVFGLQFTSTITQNRQHADKLSIPGWDGVPPIFVPFHTAYFELKEASGCPLTSISVLVLPSMGTRQLLKPLGHFYHKYSRLRVANSTYFGGIPCLHIACSNGNVEVSDSSTTILIFLVPDVVVVIAVVIVDAASVVDSIFFKISYVQLSISGSSIIDVSRGRSQ